MARPASSAKATLSNGHLYSLRQHKTYRSVRGTVDKTHPVRVHIGERRKPSPNGQPGFLRVDSVHQGDLDGVKGLYLINAVDEITQFLHPHHTLHLPQLPPPLLLSHGAHQTTRAESARNTATRT